MFLIQNSARFEPEKIIAFLIFLLIHVSMAIVSAEHIYI